MLIRSIILFTQNKALALVAVIIFYYAHLFFPIMRNIVGALLMYIPDSMYDFAETDINEWIRLREFVFTYLLSAIMIYLTCRKLTKREVATNENAS